MSVCESGGVCVSGCMYVWVYVCIYESVCGCVYVSVCIYECVCVCV